MKSVTKKHTSYDGITLVRKIIVDDQDYNFVKQNIDSVYVDICNDVPKMYNPRTKKNVSLARAILLNRKKSVTGRIINTGNNPYDVRTQNLVCK